MCAILCVCSYILYTAGGILILANYHRDSIGYTLVMKFIITQDGDVMKNATPHCPLEFKQILAKTTYTALSSNVI